MDATDGAMKAQECRSCGGGDDEHCVNERVGGAARRRVRTFRTHAPSISLPPRNDFLQKGETGDERARRERGAREFQSDEDEERALGGA